MTWRPQKNHNFFVSMPHGSFCGSIESSCGKTASEHIKMCYLNINDGDILETKILKKNKYFCVANISVIHIQVK